ncbi:MAG TPA: ABC transporter substrate-binding protein [Solirubrobacteraceae bacterium]|nr:ABC transporter substrate-binding protein [Solirubrobacteraceae bacterium]
MTTRKGWFGVAALLATVIVATGCGSSNSSSSSAAPAAAASSSSTSTSTAAPPSSSSGSGGAGSKSVTNYLSYVGGKAGKADSSLPPVTIGFVNQQGGQQTIGPLATTGAQIAVKYINTELGGIDGHPLVLKTCFIRSAEEEGTTCAQQFLANKSISVIDEGAVAIGDQSLQSTLGTTKPVIVGVAVTPLDGVKPSNVVLFGDATHVLGPFGTYAKNVLHAKTAALVYPNIAGITQGATAIADGLKAVGVNVKKVGYSESQTDLIGPLTSAGAQSADMVIPYSDSSGCVNLAKGLKQLGITDTKKIVSAPLCLNGQVAAGLGGDFPIWTYAIASSLFGDPTDPGMPAYMKVMSKYGTPAVAPDPWTIVTFGQVLTTAKFLNEVGYGKITPATVLAKAKAFTGPVALGAPSLQCGKYPSAPGICNDRTQFFLYKGKHAFVKTAGWLQPPS